MNQSKCFTVGDAIPDFTLPDHHQQPFSLAQIKDKRILLSFHPLAWTSVCAQQMQSLENAWKTFEELDTIAVGISVDSVPSKAAWAESLGIKKTRLLSDFWPHGGVAQQLGIFREDDGISERANIILSPQKTIEFVRVYEISQLPDIQEILTFLREEE